MLKGGFAEPPQKVWVGPGEPVGRSGENGDNPIKNLEARGGGSLFTQTIRGVAVHYQQTNRSVPKKNQSPTAGVSSSICFPTVTPPASRVSSSLPPNLQIDCRGEGGQIQKHWQRYFIPTNMSICFHFFSLFHMQPNLANPNSHLKRGPIKGIGGSPSPKARTAARAGPNTTRH